MKLGKKQELFTLNLAKFIIAAKEKGYDARLREIQRTPEQQEIYIKNGLSNTTKSKHLDSLAADIYFFKDGELIADVNKLKVLGELWESLDKNNRWGGHWATFKDCPHFEYIG